MLKERGELVITTPNKHSLYGMVRKAQTLVLCVVSALFRLNRLTGIMTRSQHPYDKWKTQKEVVRVIQQDGFTLCEKLAVCFIPSQLTYYLPKWLKMAIVKVSSVFENRFRHLYTANGYMIAILVRKSPRRREEG